MSTAEEISERVAAGAAWLDRQMPGWVGLIDLELLAMSDCGRCVLGQLVKSDGHADRVDYYTVASPSEYPDDPWDDVEREVVAATLGIDQQLTLGRAIELGFHTRESPLSDDLEGSQAEWRALTDEWARLILYRRA